MNIIEFESPYPEDYFKLMDEFSVKELDALMDSKANYKSDEKKLLRKMLLNKRAQFNYEKYKKGLHK